MSERRSDGRGGAKRLARTIRQRFAKLSAARVKVGVFGGATEEGFPMPAVAAVHEFGSRDGHVPQRSFLRVGVASPEVVAAATALGAALVAGTMKPRQVLERLGHVAVAAVRKTITTGSPLQPPLSSETVATRARLSGPGQRRKHTGPLLARPLVHTGQLVQSITHQVEGA